LKADSPDATKKYEDTQNDEKEMRGRQERNLIKIDKAIHNRGEIVKTERH